MYIPKFSTCRGASSIHAVVHVGIFVGLVGLAYLCYAEMLNAEFLHSWDDNQYVTHNERIRALNLDGLWQMWSQPHYWHYIPMTLMSYAVDYQVWELNPFGYHLTNLMFHVLNSLLVYLLALRLQSSRMAAVVAAVLFVVHPLQVESVVWISERKNVLSLFFFLLAVLTHIRSRSADPGWWTAGLAWGLFLLAVLSKSIVSGAPLLFIYYDVYWARRGLWRSLVANIPYGIIGVGGAIGTILAHQGNTGVISYWEDSFGLTATLMLRVTWEYLVSLVWPLQLEHLYLYTLEMIQGEPRVWAGAAVLLLALLFAWRQPLGRPLSCFAVLWTGVLMLPVANLFPFAFQRADRYLYHPSVMLFLLVGIVVVQVWRATSRFAVRSMVLAVAGGVLVSLVVLTVQRGKVWMTSETLWQAHLKSYPESSSGIMNLGVYYYNTKAYDKGYRFLSQSVSQGPTFRRAHHYLARCAFELGRLEEAMQIYERALIDWPDDLLLNTGLGYVSYRLKRYPKALTAYETALASDPTDAQVQLYMTNVGRVGLQTRDYALAERAFSTLHQALPDHPGAIGGLCQTLAGMKQMAEALTWCEQAVALQPHSQAYLGQLALVLLRTHQPEAALPWAKRAIEVAPKWAFGYRLLGDIYVATGATCEAQSAYRMALVYNPEDRLARQHQARLLKLATCGSPDKDG